MPAPRTVQRQENFLVWAKNAFRSVVQTGCLFLEVRGRWAAAVGGGLSPDCSPVLSAYALT